MKVATFLGAALMLFSPCFSNIIADQCLLCKCPNVAQTCNNNSEPRGKSTINFNAEEIRKIVVEELNKHIQVDFKCRANSRTLNQITDGYLVHNETKMSWFKANAFCEEQGLELATFENVDDLKIATKISPTTAWLSASDIGREPGFFFWKNGRQLLKKFYVNEKKPQNLNGGYFCTYLTKGKVDCTKCDDLHHVLCEVPRQCT